MTSSIRAGLLVALAASACTVGSSDTAQPGLSLKCSSGKNAWETYGATGFVTVNEAIFTNVGKEVTANGSANVGTAFNKIGTGDPPSTSDGPNTFKGKLAAFLVYAYGGPSSITYTDGLTYDGIQDMEMAHQGLGITSAQYDYFISDIVVPSLTSSGVSSADVSSCFAPVVTAPSFKATIVGQ
jgi:hypothetical protein